MVTHLTAADVLSFKKLDLSLEPGLNVVVGPNGAGKSNVGRLLGIARDAVAACSDSQWGRFESTWGRAGHHGSTDWVLRVGMTLNSVEVALVDAWVRGCLVGALIGPDEARRRLADETLAEDLQSGELFSRGELVIGRDGSHRHPWQVSWYSTQHEAHLPLWISHRLSFGPSPDAWTTPSMNLIQWLETVADPLANLAGSDTSSLTALDLLGNASVELLMPNARGDVEIPAVRSVLRALGREGSATLPPVSFAHVLDHLLSRSLLVTANNRAEPIRESPVDDLREIPDIEDGSGTAFELLRRKNGNAVDREQYAGARTIFQALLATEAELDIVVEPTDDEPSQLFVTPVVSQIPPGGTAPSDLPLELSGAGFQEAAFLSVVLTDNRPILLLDEPATNLSTTAQRRLLTVLRRRSEDRQTIIVTHTAGLVPSSTLDDLAAIVRLTNVGGSTEAHRLDLKDRPAEKALQQLQLADLRDILFSAGVWFVEGATERAAMELWLAEANSHDLPTPDEAHVRLISVGSDTAFTSYTKLADALAIPWSVLTDGRALRPNGPLKDLSTAGDATPDDWDAAKEHWNRRRVHTLADGFHTENKEGEIEKYFERVDAVAYAKAKTSRSKSLVGAAFASAVSVPGDVVDLWKLVLSDLGLSNSPDPAGG